MDINRLVEKAQEALRAAQARLLAWVIKQIDVEHLLLSLLDQEDCEAWFFQRLRWCRTLSEEPGSSEIQVR